MINTEKSIAYIALGSNLGNRGGNINKALAYLEAVSGLELVKISSIIETIPLGGPEGQGMYFNAVCKIATELTPWELLDVLLETENRLGRIRTEKDGPRTIDLDILLYNNEIIRQGDKLVIPHPRMASRRFVLELMAEIAPEVVHPELNASMIELLDKYDNGE
ncbi:MAG: 2-amino-4-hydroxy-6-hydroxymethyldihydropteridine diphosphokinase [Sedimentisphaerales bacterium]|nr:2-amino-4-hydroxy-6-hydroxymethyldihydropteridine diphosphokinase [Sedimentisphaerales bacterium]MBN2843759.1 2-amino-4-hydroxy-6-hydroxymethyldihydropteridine diphosphokinase [Sedimentisphaerales bacterium]